MIRLRGIVAPVGVLSTNNVDFGPDLKRGRMIFARTAFDYLHTEQCPITDGHSDKEFPVEQMTLRATTAGLHLDATADIPRELVRRFTGMSVSFEDPFVDITDGIYTLDDVAHLVHIAFCTRPRWAHPTFPETKHLVQIQEIPECTLSAL